MKTLSLKIALLVMMVTCLCLTASGQKGYEEVVYLKNGSVIRGIIIEKIPGQSIKIKTGNDSTIIVEEKDIDRIVRQPGSSKDLRKGYIGFMLGVSSPRGAFADQRKGSALGGAHLNLARFGYLITNHVGVSAQWYGGANLYAKSANGDEFWSYGGLMAGLLLSPHREPGATRRWELDLSPMIGYAGSFSPDFGNGEGESLTGAFMLAGNVRWNVGNKVCILFALDWFYTKARFENIDLTQEIFTSSVGFGVAYRLR